MLAVSINFTFDRCYFCPQPGRYSGFLSLLTIGGGPSVSGYGSREFPFARGGGGIDWNCRGGGGGPSLIGVLGGRGGGSVGPE